MIARVVFGVFLLFLTGCASQTRHAVNSLDRQNPVYQSDVCQQSFQLADFHDQLQKTRMVGTPLVLLASSGTGALVAMLAANMGLDTLDRLDASHVVVVCDGPETPSFNIWEKVFLGAGLQLFTNGIKFGGN